MKQTHYTVYYLNGVQEEFYAFSFQEAMILGSAYAISCGRDRRIKYIYDKDRGEECNPETVVTIGLTPLVTNNPNP